MKIGKVLDAIFYNVVFECFVGSRKSCPKLLKVAKLATIYRDDPVVWEMFVADFSHLRLGSF
jgi:hypothetical protein